MKKIIDVPDDWEKRIGEMLDFQIVDFLYGIIRNGRSIPNDVINENVIDDMTGKEILTKYCQEHSGEEIYNFLRRLFDESMNWTDSRGFIIEWLEEGNKDDK